jgi:hypothetical protein
MMMFFCESALEAQRAGTRAAANKSKKTRGRRLMRSGGMEEWGWEGGGRGAMQIIQRLITHLFTQQTSTLLAYFLLHALQTMREMKSLMLRA